MPTPPLSSQLSIHEISKGIDNSFTASGDPFVTLVTALPPSSSATMFNYRLYILTGGG